MSVSCDRCNERSKKLEDYENYPPGATLVVCHACANEMRNEK